MGEGGRVHEKPVCRGNCLKLGRASTVCRFKGGALREVGVDTPMHTMIKRRFFLRQTLL